jgi:hypothetical protein
MIIIPETCSLSVALGLAIGVALGAIFDFVRRKVEHEEK